MFFLLLRRYTIRSGFPWFSLSSNLFCCNLIILIFVCFIKYYNTNFIFVLSKHTNHFLTFYFAIIDFFKNIIYNSDKSLSTTQDRFRKICSFYMSPIKYFIFRKGIHMSFKYLQLATELQAEIAQGTFTDKLPTEKVLSEAYQVSRQTVRQALAHLVELGLIEKRQGSGSRVVDVGLHSKPDRIAIVTSYIDDYIFPSVLQDIQKALTSQNYSTMLFATQNQLNNERSILQRLLRQPLGGLIVEGTKTALPNPNLDLYETFSKAEIPVIFIHGCYHELKDAICVSDDNFGGGYLLTRHLISKGHTHIAGIFKGDDIQGHQRYLGCLSALRDAGLTLPDRQILWYTTEERRYLLDFGHSDLLEHFLQFYLANCTAVVCYNDEIADKLIRLLLQKHRRVPEDVAVVSFDNSYYSDLCPVPITSLSHEAHKLGRMAATLLLDRIAGKPSQSQSLSWRLMQKNSG